MNIERELTEVAQASAEPTAWYDAATGAFYLSLQSIPKDRIDIQRRVVALAPVASAAPDADRLDAERYRFIRSMIHMTEDEQQAASAAMHEGLSLAKEGSPTDAEWDACIDAAIAAAPKELT